MNGLRQGFLSITFLTLNWCFFLTCLRSLVLKISVSLQSLLELNTCFSEYLFDVKQTAQKNVLLNSTSLMHILHQGSHRHSFVVKHPEFDILRPNHQQIQRKVNKHYWLEIIMAPRPINKLWYNNVNEQNFNIPPRKLISIIAHNNRIQRLHNIIYLHYH